jgi:formate/nitrite transporter FocA (FNT family)
MASALDPAEIFERAASEGERRLDQSLLELAATGFIAGFTIIFGIIALGIVEALARPVLGDLAKLLGALAFGTGLVFLIVGRAELFSENFFDPIAAGFRPGKQKLAGRLARLWSLTFLLNLAGGAVLILVASVGGTLPSGASDALNRIAEEIAHRPWLPTLTRAIIGGALVALLSFLVIASRETTSRIIVAYAVGVLLALGPFDHVIVSMLHVGFGLASTANVTLLHAAEVGLIATVGNLIGGVGLVTLAHAAQAKAAERRSGKGGGERRD